MAVQYVIVCKDEIYKWLMKAQATIVTLVLEKEYCIELG